MENNTTADSGQEKSGNNRASPGIQTGGNIVCDSRAVAPGDTFVAVSGAASDGNTFVGDAIRAGAKTIVSEHPRPTDVPESAEWICVDDARQALAELACAHYGNPSEKLAVFGVTGTNGKTTTATLLCEYLNFLGIKSGLVSTIFNMTEPPSKNIVKRVLGRARGSVSAAKNTTPGPLELQRLFAEMLANGCKACVMEVSSHALDQQRTHGTRFAVAGFTNLTGDHLDYHANMENYFAAKRKLFLAQPVPAAVNIDDAYGKRLADDIEKSKRVTFGASPEADVSFANAQLTIDGATFDLRYPGGTAKIKTCLLGMHNIYNVLTAFAMMLAHGIAPKKIVKAINSVDVYTAGRLEKVRVKSSPAAFFVDYAHTHDALENVLRSLRPLTKERLFVVFGAGGDRDKTKRPLMGKVADALADIVIVTSDNPRSEDPNAIIDDILRGIPSAAEPPLGDTATRAPSDEMPRVLRMPDRRTAIRHAVLMADRAGDVVLVAGKGHENYQIFADRTELFDDRVELAMWGE